MQAAAVIVPRDFVPLRTIADVLGINTWTAYRAIKRHRLPLVMAPDMERGNGPNICYARVRDVAAVITTRKVVMAHAK